MGTKKVELSVILSIETQENWDKMLKFNGLLIVDLYQEWHGQCKSVISLFNKLHGEINDERIMFAQVKVDNIRSLYPYKGKCEPTFLFLGGGQLVGIVRGANAPIIRQLCFTKFHEELKVMKGEMERILIRDPGVTRSDLPEDIHAETLFDFIEGEMTFAIFKQDTKSHNMVYINERIENEDLIIVRKEIRPLCKDEILGIYNKYSNNDFFNDLICYLTAGTCCAMAVMSLSHNPVMKLKEIVAQLEDNMSMENQPENIKALIEMCGFKNNIYCANSREEALKSISIVFPDLVFKKNDPLVSDSEEIIVLIPERIYSDDKKSILNQLTNDDLIINKQTEIVLLKHEIDYLYKEIIIIRDLMEDAVEEIYGSKFFVISLKGKDSINIVNYMLGLYNPDEDLEYKKITIRDIDPPNFVYASLNKSIVIRDRNYFFPIEQTFAIIKPDAYEQRDEIIQLIKSGVFSISLADDIILSQDVAEQIYSNIKDMGFFQTVINNMISGPCFIMVLSKYDAVSQWTDFIGSTNPEEAAEQSPDKLRGIFGSTLVQNALHNASSIDNAFRCINMLFGNVQFDEKGNVSIQKPIDSEKNFPTKIYQPVNVNESKIQDVIQKFQPTEEISFKKIEKELSIKEICKLYSSLKTPETFLNVKCFVELAAIIIPVMSLEENEAFNKIDQINKSSQRHKNNSINFDIWAMKFQDPEFSTEMNYIIYEIIESE